MNDKYKDAAKMLLTINASLYVTMDYTPQEGLPIDQAAFTRFRMSEGMMSRPEVICAGKVVGYYTHSDSQINTSDIDYPELYKHCESMILSNTCFTEFLSAYADALLLEGDSLPFDRLKSSGRYVESSRGKSVVLKEFDIPTNTMSR